MGGVKAKASLGEEGKEIGNEDLQTISRGYDKTLGSISFWRCQI